MGLPAISGSDIFKLLDKVPEWLGLKRQLARIGELEARVAALEAALAAKPAANLCPACEKGALKFVSERPDPIFGFGGMKERTLRCDLCGHETTRQIDTTKS